jgi:hypothetical protein
MLAQSFLLPHSFATPVIAGYCDAGEAAHENAQDINFLLPLYINP